ncbi:SPOR domain-containing protein [Caulobacter segnis]|uniref:Sporulation domain protein n=2 Tax=Caulobacter segnis TaxID=88688 RepID=D5VIU5_CAUST|nr:SPOR domain-containing protein [Caulobacter segnis]ADG09911.1 Sporulation domain protein [Caulobacter segnis ATCC 21756]AVQ01669.1 SPOR domain-containing protein [Caulobacter segnis]
MSDPHRGAYTPPTDAPLSFDARQPVRGARPLPMTLIISAVVLVTLVVGVALVYRGGIRNPNEPPPAVGSQVAEMKAPPPANSQPQDPAAGLQIYQSDEAQPSATFAAPPETPQPRPAVPLNTAPVQSAALPPSKPAAAPTIESLATDAVAPKPAPKPVQVAAATPAPKPVAAAPTAAAPKPVATATGPASVQIGALSSPALADKAWTDAVRLAPGLAAGKGKKVETVDKNGTTLYRTSVTGFPNREAAKAFCEAIAASGKSCFVK